MINTCSIVIMAIFTLGAYQYCEALECYFCHDHVDHGANNRPYRKCFEGGRPVAQSDNPYPIVKCEEKYEDPSLCLVKLTFEGEDLKRIKKDCFLKREVDILRCAEDRGYAIRKGENCVVIKRHDWINLECDGSSGRSLEKNGTSDQTTGEMSGTKPELEVAFCTCQGNLCNDELADADYEAIGITNKYPYGEDNGTLANHFSWTVTAVGMMVIIARKL